MEHSNVLIAMVAGVILLAALFRNLLQRGSVSGPIAALALGVVLGPRGLDLEVARELAGRVDLLGRIAWLTIGVSLMAIALALPRDYLKRRWRSVLVILGLGMPLMWAASSVIVWAVLGGGVAGALLLGAVVTPTDPVLATSIVEGPYARRCVPARIRRLLHVESAANDGLAYAFVMLPVLLMGMSASEAAGAWLGRVVLWQVIGGAAIGAIAGWVIAGCQKWAYRRGISDESGLLAVVLAMTFMLLTGVEALGGEGLMAVFTAGIVFNWMTGDPLEREQERIQETVLRFFHLPVFVLLGIMIPWEQWGSLGWRGAALVGALFLLRRLPAMFIMRPVLPAMRSASETVFAGWFGPVGIAALFYAAHVRSEGADDEIWAATTLVVVGSTLVHGFTATPFSKWLGGHETEEAARGDT